MGLLFVKNKSHNLSDLDSELYCEIQEFNLVKDFAKELRNCYHTEGFNKEDWSVTRDIDLMRVLRRVLTSSQLEFEIVVTTDDELEKFNSLKLLHNCTVAKGKEEDTIVKYKRNKYRYGYALNPKDMLDNIDNMNLCEMSDALSLCNALNIKIDWSRLDMDVVDVERVTRK